MPEVMLDASDVAELAEMLQFLTGWLDPDGSTIRFWPQRDTVPGRVHDQVRVEAGLRLADASGRPFADEGHPPGRWQRADPVTPVPVTQPTTETLQIQRNTGESGTLVQLRPAAKVRGLPAISELHAEMNRFMRCHFP